MHSRSEVLVADSQRALLRVIDWLRDHAVHLEVAGLSVPPTAQGNNGRLVITPLTDRCYMTLGAALFTRRGGNPLGPAGTGKTETVKDFGKALARYVIVFNCSDGVDYKMTGKMLSGLSQTGAWACLDEFNRIEVEVLSVVATQISMLMQAVKEQRAAFNFLGQTIRLIPTCGVFVTMNPGYAGRSELPDNLKAIVRPVSMMVPDFTLIAEIMMFSEGFSIAKVLSKKMIAIMELSQQQLSKQDHYDYGLRSFVIPIARAAGALKRADPDASEEVIMYRTMLDLIKPKLVYLDLPLFMALLSDLFPGVELPAAEGGELRATLEAELLAAGLQVVPEFVTKIIQVCCQLLLRCAAALLNCSEACRFNIVVRAKSACQRCRRAALALANLTNTSARSAPDFCSMHSLRVWVRARRSLTARSRGMAT
jgi:dynein heavy chain, axonemal